MKKLVLREVSNTPEVAQLAISWASARTSFQDNLLSLGSHRVGHNWSYLACIGEGNDNPLHCPCLENPRDGGAWWAAIYGVAESDMTEAT